MIRKNVIFVTPYKVENETRYKTRSIGTAFVKTAKDRNQNEFEFTDILLDLIPADFTKGTIRIVDFPPDTTGENK